MDSIARRLSPSTSRTRCAVFPALLDELHHAARRPRCRDGLKPVHRRILWTMHEDNMVPGGSWYKSARLVGDVMEMHPTAMPRSTTPSSAWHRISRRYRWWRPRQRPSAGQRRGDVSRNCAWRHRQEMVTDISRDTVDMAELRQQAAQARCCPRIEPADQREHRDRGCPPRTSRRTTCARCATRRSPIDNPMPS